MWRILLYMNAAQSPLKYLGCDHFVPNDLFVSFDFAALLLKGHSYFWFYGSVLPAGLFSWTCLFVLSLFCWSETTWYDIADKSIGYYMWSCDESDCKMNCMSLIIGSTNLKRTSLLPQSCHLNLNSCWFISSMLWILVLIHWYFSCTSTTFEDIRSLFAFCRDIFWIQWKTTYLTYFRLDNLSQYTWCHSFRLKVSFIYT